MANRQVVRSLWIGQHLPAFVADCLQSFVVQGHPFELFCYSVPRGLPQGVVPRDAAEILPESEVFEYGPASNEHEGSLAAFSNLFRYEMLNRLGEYWVDTDIFCVRPLPNMPATSAGEGVLIASERTKSGKKYAATCVMRSPPRHPLIVRAIADSRAADQSTLQFGQTGPHLIDRLLGEFGRRDVLADPNMFCPVNWFNFTDLVRPKELSSETYCVHLWNEMWRSTGQAIPWPGPKGSLLANLKERLDHGSVPAGPLARHP